MYKRQVLEDAAGLERGLLGAGDESDEQFRRRLAEIISSLGGARWRKEVQEDPDVGSADTSASVEGVHASVASSSITGAPGSAL